MIDEATIEAIANRLAAKLRGPAVRPLWTAEDVGKYLRLEPRVVTEKWRHKEGTPKPIKFGRDLRWEQDEIIAYAKKHKER